jgi:hypothetical protein
VLLPVGKGLGIETELCDKCLGMWRELRGPEKNFSLYPKIYGNILRGLSKVVI